MYTDDSEKGLLLIIPEEVQPGSFRLGNRVTTVIQKKEGEGRPESWGAGGLQRLCVLVLVYQLFLDEKRLRKTFCVQSFSGPNSKWAAFQVTS